MIDENEFETCIVHVTDTDPDCEFCTAQIEAMRAAYQEVVEDNIEIEKGILRQGAQLNPMSTVQLKLEVLISMAFSDPKARVHFDLAFIRAYRNMLTNASQEITRAKLMAPGMPRPS